MIIIRPESEEHAQGVRVVEEKAFGRPTEANLVDRLKARGKASISLVALEEGHVVGHILFSPVTIGEVVTLRVLGLGPVAVLPKYQRQGIGSRLVRTGLEECRQLGVKAVVVLGDPRYYARFGFQPAGRFGIHFQDARVPAEDFMVIELHKGVLEERGGTARYEPEFDEV